MTRRPPERTPPAPTIRPGDEIFNRMILPPIGSHEDNPFAPKRQKAIVCRYCGLRYDGDAPQFCSGCGAGL